LELHLTPGSQTLPPGKGSGLQAVDGWTQCRHLGGGQNPSLRPKKIPILFLFFLSQNSLNTFQKCKKYKDRWAKPLSSVHICGTWKVILVQISTLMLMPL